MKTATINVRVDENLKKNCEEIFEEFGFGMTTAITMFLKAVNRTKTIPFDFEIPNEETLKAFAEADDPEKSKKRKSYKSVSELRKDLNI